MLIFRLQFVVIFHLSNLYNVSVSTKITGKYYIFLCTEATLIYFVNLDQFAEPVNKLL